MFSDMLQKKEKKDDETEISVRSPDEIEPLEKLVNTGPITFILVHADWCGPCQRYKPLWKEMTNIPGRSANMAMIHHDMVEKSSMLKNAKIPGYPTVLKVFPNGHIENYKDEANKQTNAVPNIRDTESMKKELLTIPVLNVKNNSKSVIKSKNVAKSNAENLLSELKVIPVSRFSRRNIANTVPKTINNLPKIKTSKEPSEVVIGATNAMKGGNLYMALSAALKASAPAATLLFANEVLRSRSNRSSRRKTVSIPPKKYSGSTKRLTRKANRR